MTQDACSPAYLLTARMLGAFVQDPELLSEATRSRATL